MTKDFDLGTRKLKGNATIQATNAMLNVFEEDDEDFEEPRESKTQRLYIIVTPTLHKQLKQVARKKKMSKNAIVNEALERYLNTL